MTTGLYLRLLCKLLNQEKSGDELQAKVPFAQRLGK